MNKECGFKLGRSVVHLLLRLVRVLTFFICAGCCFVCSVRFLLLFCVRFTGRNGVPGADLLTTDSELTELGQTFFDTYKNLQRCTDDSSASAKQPTPSPASPVAFPEIAGEFSFLLFQPLFYIFCIHDLGTNGPRSDLILFLQQQQKRLQDVKSLSEGLPCGTAQCNAAAICQGTHRGGWRSCRVDYCNSKKKCQVSVYERSLGTRAAGCL